MGLSGQLAVVQTVAPAGGEIARNPVAAHALLVDAANSCVREHGADVVILGGAGLAGLADILAPHVACPLIDSVTATVRAAERLGETQPMKSVTGSYAATTPVPTIGLAEALAARMEGRA